MLEIWEELENIKIHKIAHLLLPTSMSQKKKKKSPLMEHLDNEYYSSWCLHFTIPLDS